MRASITANSGNSFVYPWQCVMLAGAFAAAALLSGSSSYAQTTPTTPAATASPRAHHASKAHAHQAKKPEPPPVAQTPPPPPMPDWPANNKANPASVVWDATGLRINASNSSLQQILNEVSTETGTKIEGPVPDQRVYGDYGPGKAREVLSQLLQGSGFNVLLAGDIGQGAPREIVLSPRSNGTGGTDSANRPQQDPDDEIPDQPEDEPQQQLQQPQGNFRPGFGPNGPVRTPQQVMEEMQQRQLQQQQQMQQQQQQQASPNPQ